MYSRYSNRPEKPIRIPEHYSGCAFSEYRTEDAPTRTLGVAKPSPPPQEPPSPTILVVPTEPPPSVSQEPQAHRKEDEECLLPHASKEAPSKPKEEARPAMKSLLGGFGKGLTFSKGLDFDQLLILGLILLLSHSEQDSEIVWWLGLLLLCG
ncbi:MAG: hypothetical protein IJX80_10730 [Clostridia bacterium]|nr:hypothetical protein [Clostridia bacterium]